MRVSPWKELSRKLYEHSKYRKIMDICYELPNGKQETFSLSHVGRVATVLALTRDQQVILARQFRPGPNQILDDLPGGLVEEGESFAQAAARELREETGYHAGRLLALGRLFSDAFCTCQEEGFLALDCEKIASQDLDSNEFIEVVLKPVPEFLEQIREGLSTSLHAAWTGLYAAGYLEFKSRVPEKDVAA